MICSIIDSLNKQIHMSILCNSIVELPVNLKTYLDRHRIVSPVSRYASCREPGVSLQPVNSINGHGIKYNLLFQLPV